MRPIRVIIACILVVVTLAIGWGVYSIVEPTVTSAGCSTIC